MTLWIRIFASSLTRSGVKERDWSSLTRTVGGAETTGALLAHPARTNASATPAGKKKNVFIWSSSCEARTKSTGRSPGHQLCEQVHLCAGALVGGSDHLRLLRRLQGRLLHVIRVAIRLPIHCGRGLCGRGGVARCPLPLSVVCISLYSHGSAFLI